MKIALITDTHFGARNDNVIFSNYFRKFYDNVFFPRIEEYNIKACIHLGDVVDRRKYINFKTANDLRENFVDRLWKMGVDTHFIIGNHDIFYKNTNEINSMTELFSTSDGLYEPWVYSSPREVDFDGTKIIMMPWITSDNYTECMDAIKKTSSQIMMGHLEINGFLMNYNQVCDYGVDMNTFSKFDLVYSGHFHHKSTQGSITYLGNPYEITWADIMIQEDFIFLILKQENWNLFKILIACFIKFIMMTLKKPLNQLKKNNMKNIQELLSKL